MGAPISNTYTKDTAISELLSFPASTLRFPGCLSSSGCVSGALVGIVFETRFRVPCWFRPYGLLLGIWFSFSIHVNVGFPSECLLGSLGIPVCRSMLALGAP